MHKLHAQLSSIIKNQQLTSLFQPIVSSRQQNIYAYEALIRGPSDSSLHNPINLFSAAERCNKTVALERSCRRTSIRQFADQQLPQKLFLNVSPLVLLDPDFKKGETLDFLKKVAIPASRIVIEITEHQPTDNYQLMRDAVAHYRNMGFEIALDDLGAGYSGLRLWTELMPDYVKIDRHFIQDIDKDPVKLNFVRSIQSMAVATNCHVIAEGIETEEEFQAIEKLGVGFFQGYYFARPAAQAVTKIADAKFSGKQALQHEVTFKSTLFISEIMHEVAAISSDTSNNEVLKLFQKDSQLNVIPLVDNGVAIGLVYKDQFLSKMFASRYGIDLHGKKSVKSFVDLKPFVFDCKVAVEEVSQQLTNNVRTDLAFIITENGCYQGIGLVMDLLQLITAQQLKNAQHANPLTLLPGITPINNIINSMIADKTRFTIGYFDLDNFKPFNDIYGYEKGDQAISLVAELLSKSIVDSSGYVGHIGGDDFIVIYMGQSWEKACQQVLGVFKQRVLGLYNKEHQKEGGIQAFDRKGMPCFYSLLSLSIGIVSSDAIMKCRSHIEVADMATEAKHQAKKIPGNSYFINRRMPGEKKECSSDFIRSTEERQLTA
jgi:diguanylate cyclase (GGDEF)-like protein